MSQQPETGRRIRVLIVDDHQMVRAGLRAMLRDTKVEIVGEATDLEGALAGIEEHSPDAILLDVRLQGQSGLEACRVITHRHPGLAVVFLTVYEDEQYVFEALRAGAKGYMLNGRRPRTSSGSWRRCSGARPSSTRPSPARSPAGPPKCGRATSGRAPRWG